MKKRMRNITTVHQGVKISLTSMELYPAECNPTPHQSDHGLPSTRVVITNLNPLLFQVLARNQKITYGGRPTWSNGCTITTSPRKRSCHMLLIHLLEKLTISGYKKMHKHTTPIQSLIGETSRHECPRSLQRSSKHATTSLPSVHTKQHQGMGCQHLSWCQFWSTSMSNVLSQGECIQIFQRTQQRLSKQF